MSPKTKYSHKVSVIFGELIGRYVNDYIMNVSIKLYHGVFEAESHLWYGTTKVFELSHSHRYHEQGMPYRNPTLHMWLCYTQRGLAETSWSWSFGNGMGYCAAIHHYQHSGSLCILQWHIPKASGIVEWDALSAQSLCELNAHSRVTCTLGARVERCRTS